MKNKTFECLLGVVFADCIQLQLHAGAKIHNRCPEPG